MLRYALALGCLTAAAACGQSRGVRSGRPPRRTHVGSAAGDVSLPTLAYAGHDAHGVPHYAHGPFTADDSVLLRRAYGVEDPGRLYLSDSTAEGALKYDTRAKSCAHCYVNSYRVGFASVRRPGESWEEVERRVERMPVSAFPDSAKHESDALTSLDPAIQREVAGMLAAAARTGFVVHVVATYRSALAEAYMMRAHGSTHTLTSMHSYRRAFDVAIGDGNVRHARTRREWIAFRRWVTAYAGGEFRILGRPDATWDWGHVEVPSPQLGFHSIDAAIDRASACTTQPPRVPCDFPAPRISSAANGGTP